MKICIFWFRRDLRLNDNTGLKKAIKYGLPVLPVFIFDDEILEELHKDDPRVTFIHETLSGINTRLKSYGSSLLVEKGQPAKVFEKLSEKYDVDSIFVNRDYEPYAIERDRQVRELLGKKGIKFNCYKDHVIFEENDVLKPDGKPYTVFTPYSRRWLAAYAGLQENTEIHSELQRKNFIQSDSRFPSLIETGFKTSNIRVRQYDLSVITNYHSVRDYPAVDGTTYLSPHLRFGTVSIRDLVRRAYTENKVFLGELIWREFFMMILFHFPHVVTDNFKRAYDGIEWRNNGQEFEKWCKGETGYPIVDAGMRQLNETGYMHNRVRMITASFLCKHLFTDWKRGEAYFAEKLLDYELSSNIGNWQWAAGSGCDATPYFRVFNPETQQKKFDPKNEYVKRWVDDFGKPGYPSRMTDHVFARNRAIEGYKRGLIRSLK